MQADFRRFLYIWYPAASNRIRERGAQIENLHLDRPSTDAGDLQGPPPDVVE
jgi:hypothetical protein